MKSIKTILRSIRGDIECYLRVRASQRVGYHPSGDIMIFSTARSGSTWVKEVIASQSNIKYVSEPLLMDRMTRRQLGADPSWELTVPGGNREAILKEYFQRQFDGKCGYGSPIRRSEFYRKNYDRVVLKLLRCQDMMNWCEDVFGAKVVYLLRHPMPVALSRKEYKRLPMFIQSQEFRKRFLTDRQHAYAVEVLNNGSELDHKILDWCLQNLAPLKHLDRDNWLIIYYEDIVMQPENELKRLTDYLVLDDANAAAARINQASSTTYKSDLETQKVLNEEGNQSKRRLFLANKWLTRVDIAQIQSAQAIFDQFGIDVYSADNPMPQRRI